MPLQFLIQSDPPSVAMFDDYTQWAFGPVVTGDDAMEKLAAFLNALGDDPRVLAPWQLEAAWTAWSATVEDSEPETPEADAGRPVTEAPSGLDGAIQGAQAAEDANATVGGGSPDLTLAGAAYVVPPGATEPIPNPTAHVEISPDISTAPPPAPVQVPVGARECWNCKATRVEPDGSGNPCGICVGKGWLPA